MANGSFNVSVKQLLLDEPEFILIRQVQLHFILQRQNLMVGMGTIGGRELSKEVGQDEEENDRTAAGRATASRRDRAEDLDLNSS